MSLPYVYEHCARLEWAYFCLAIGWGQTQICLKYNNLVPIMDNNTNADPQGGSFTPVIKMQLDCLLP